MTFREVGRKNASNFLTISPFPRVLECKISGILGDLKKHVYKDLFAGIR